MKKNIALIFAAGTLFLAGCCTTEHTTKWEYKVVRRSSYCSLFWRRTHHTTINRDSLQNAFQKQRETNQDFLNNLGKDGWELIKEEDGTFYFKRAIK